MLRAATKLVFSLSLSLSDMIKKRECLRRESLLLIFTLTLFFSLSFFLLRVRFAARKEEVRSFSLEKGARISFVN
jgi:hypothetical protein